MKYALTQEGDPDNMGTADDAFKIVKLLAEHGADVNTANARGETALYGAAFVGRDRVIAFLADRGAKLHLGAALDDMMVGQDVTVLVQGKARAGRSQLGSRRLGSRGKLPARTLDADLGLLGLGRLLGEVG